jgi:hypothetical protein
LFDFDIHMDEEKPTPKIDVLLHETPSATPLVVHGGQAPRNSTPHCGSRWTDYFFPLTRFWLFPLIACDQSVPLWGSVATTFCFVLLLLDSVSSLVEDRLHGEAFPNEFNSMKQTFKRNQFKFIFSNCGRSTCRETPRRRARESRFCQTATTLNGALSFLRSSLSLRLIAATHNVTCLALLSSGKVVRKQAAFAARL